MLWMLEFLVCYWWLLNWPLLPSLPPFSHPLPSVSNAICARLTAIHNSVRLVQFISVPQAIGSLGRHEEWFSRDPVPVFCVRGHCEQFWHRQGHPLFDVVHPSVPLPSWCCPPPKRTWRMFTERLTWHVEVSREKSKIMANSTNNISGGTSMNGQKLEELTSFKYLGATLSNDGTCSTELIRITSATAMVARLNRIWWRNTISFSNMFKFD